MRLQWQIQRGRYEGYIPHENAMRERDRETEMWKEVIFFSVTNNAAITKAFCKPDT